MTEELRLESLSFDSDSEVRITLIASDGTVEAFVFTINSDHGITSVSGSREFSKLYRQVPGPDTPQWPERLAIAAWNARQDPLPSGASLVDLVTEAREDVTRRWQESQRHITDRL